MSKYIYRITTDRYFKALRHSIGFLLSTKVCKVSRGIASVSAKIHTKEFTITDWRTCSHRSLDGYSSKPWLDRQADRRAIRCSFTRDSELSGLKKHINCLSSQQKLEWRCHGLWSNFVDQAFQILQKIGRIIHRQPCGPCNPTATSTDPTSVAQWSVAISSNTSWKK